jgi:hypothetical protein
MGTDTMWGRMGTDTIQWTDRGHVGDTDAQPDICVWPKATHTSYGETAPGTQLFVRDVKGSVRHNEFA